MYTRARNIAIVLALSKVGVQHQTARTVLFHHALHLIAAQALVDHHRLAVATPHRDRRQLGDLELLRELGQAVLVDPGKAEVGRQLAEQQRRRGAVCAYLRAELHDGRVMRRRGGRFQPAHAEILVGVLRFWHARFHSLRHTCAKFPKFRTDECRIRNLAVVRGSGERNSAGIRVPSIGA